MRQSSPISMFAINDPPVRVLVVCMVDPFKLGKIKNVRLEPILEYSKSFNSTVVRVHRATTQQANTLLFDLLRSLRDVVAVDSNT